MLVLRLRHGTHRHNGDQHVGCESATADGTGAGDGRLRADQSGRRRHERQCRLHRHGPGRLSRPGARAVDRELDRAVGRRYGRAARQPQAARGRAPLRHQRPRRGWAARAMSRSLANAVMLDGQQCFGFVIPRYRPPPDDDGAVSAAPGDATVRSEPADRDWIGRVSMKELVRDAIDVIERLCIESALELTGNNRASAAEMLGLSRQSLYVKLRRYGLSDPGRCRAGWRGRIVSDQIARESAGTVRLVPAVGTLSWPRPRALLELLKPITWFAPIWAFGCGTVCAWRPGRARLGRGSHRPRARRTARLRHQPGRLRPVTIATSTPSTSRIVPSHPAAYRASGASGSPSAWTVLTMAIACLPRRAGGNCDRHWPRFRLDILRPAHPP